MTFACLWLSYHYLQPVSKKIYLSNYFISIYKMVLADQLCWQMAFPLFWRQNINITCSSLCKSFSRNVALNLHRMTNEAVGHLILGLVSFNIMHAYYWHFVKHNAIYGQTSFFNFVQAIGVLTFENYDRIFWSHTLKMRNYQLRYYQ